MPTLSERISVLFDKADQLEGEIRDLKKDLSKMDEIDSIEYLADVPTQINNAKYYIEACLMELSLAEKYAIMGRR